MTGVSSAVPRRSRLQRVLRTLALDVRSLAVLPFGAIRFARTGQTPERAYQALVWLFCSTGGRFNDFLSRVIERRRPKMTLARPVGVLGTMDHARAVELADRLRRDGCVLFESALPAATCDRLLEFAMRTPATIRRMDHESKALPLRRERFDAQAPLAVRYDYATAELLDNADVQALLADPSILALMQEYLGCLPAADVLSMWWHTGYHAQPDSEAAQFFHFDLDRIKWLKIFVYLTDVGPDNGPHSFVRGSHRTGGIPQDLLDKGYVRLSDDEVRQAFPAQDILTLTGRRGSIIVEDTRGLHKGANVRGDARLVLQLQFSNSLFGADYPRARMSVVRDPELERLMSVRPDIYRQYT